MSICYLKHRRHFFIINIQGIFVSTCKSITFRRIYQSSKNLSRFDGNYEKAWLSKIAVRKCLDYLKAAGRRSIPTEDTYFSQIPDRQSSPEDEYMKTASNTHVEALCMQLKSPYKEVAYAHFCKELSVPEIAQQTGKNPKTIQTQLYRARAMLKKMLERGD